MPNYRLERDSIQFGFYNSRAKIQIFGGGFANGKTTAGVMKALTCAKDYPGSSGLIARATYPKLNDTIRKEFMSWCPAHWIKKRPTQEDNSCYLQNGSAIHFRYVAQKGKSREDGSTSSNLLSATYDWIVVDQIEDPEIEYKDFLDLLGRLRGSTPYRPDVEDETMPSSGPRWMVCMANPSQNWFYKEVVHPYIIWRDKGILTDKLIVDSDTGKPLIDLFEGSTYTNEANLSKDFIKTLEASYKGQMRDRYLLGKWAAFEGLVHPGFELSRHTLTRDQAISYLNNCLSRHVRIQVIEGYDFGLVSPSVYLLGFVDDYGRVIIIDGYYQGEFDYTEQPQAIRDIRSRYVGQLNASEPINADPAIFRRQVIAGTKSTGDTLAKLFTNLGIHMRPSSNDILPGIAKVNAYLSGLPSVPHIITGETPGPLLYVVDDLPWFQDEMTSYYWKRNPQGQQVDEPIDHNDHAMNTLKYMLARQPEVSKIVVPKDKLPPQWSFWHEVEMDHA